MKKKILIAGGGYADIPLIKAAKDMGFYVITTGNRQNDLGHQHSDKYINEDFSDPEAMLQLSEKLEINAICACCNDFSAISASYVAEKLNLRGHDPYDITRLLHHKDSYRKFAIKHHISSPYGAGYSSIESAIKELTDFNYPVIIKPVDLTGGKGISRARDLTEAKTAIHNAFLISREKKIIIEEFLTGSYHGFSCFIINKEVVFSFMDNEHYFKNPYMVSGASSPSLAGKHIENALLSDANKLASLLNLVNGVLHIQFIIHNNRPVIIEVCRRAPGDLYIRLVQHATGINYPSWIIQASSGIDTYNTPDNKTPAGFYIRHCIMADKNGEINDVITDKSLADKIIDQMIWWKKGDIIHDYLTYKAGIVFLKFDSQQEMNELSDRLPELINIQIKD